MGQWLILLTSLCICSIVLYLELCKNSFDAKFISMRIDEYIVNSEGCQIPRLDPFHPLVKHLEKPVSLLDCSSSYPPLVVQGSNNLNLTLVLRKENMKYYGQNVSCSYQAVSRDSEDVSVLEKAVHKINHEITVVSDEFVMVNCYNTRYGFSSKVFDDFFAFIPRKEHVEKRVADARKNMQFKPDEQMSVLLLGIDAVSKSHFHRMMVKTLNYLRQHVPMIEMYGYNKLGWNTFPNMLPFFTGFAEGEVNHTNDRPVNFLPFVWKDYLTAGYRLLHSEDNANTAIFRYVRKGFAEQPSDYYWRTLKIAAQNSSLTSASTFGCFKNRQEADAILKWTLDFFDNFPNEPLFALTFLSHFSHDTLRTLSRYDEPYMNFIKAMHERSHLNRTIVLFFSDHGFNYGEARETFLGRLENKLPFLFVLVPSWFQEKYHEVAFNLRQNANKLITLLDLHAVLEDLSNFTALGTPEARQGNRGHSINLLRTVVSGKRTCSEAKIPPQFCACTMRQEISTTSSEVFKATETLLDKINEFTKPMRHLCVELTLVSIRNAASQTVPMDDTPDRNWLIYQVTLQVTPGDGIFEGSVWHSDKTNEYTADPNIERINRYGNQSACVTERLMVPFCFCS